MSAPLPACVARLTDEQVRRRLRRAVNDHWLGIDANSWSLVTALPVHQSLHNEFMRRTLDNTKPFYRMERNEKPSWYVRWWKRIRHAKETRK